MRAGANASKGLTPTDPPVFDPSQDLLEWRRNIARWVDTISTAASKGSDRLYQTIFATLANHLYDRGLPSAQKSIVDEAQAKGLINYKQEDQVAAVKQIVELIAVDPPIAVVSRLISSFNAVTNCRRQRNEDLGTFVSRFRGLAADHLMHGGLSSSSQVGEVLAITLLNNANLSEETLTSAKLQLISLAQARETKAKETPPPTEDATRLSEKTFKKMTDFADFMVDIVGREELFAQDDDSLNRSRQKVEACNNIIKYVKARSSRFVNEINSYTEEKEKEKEEAETASKTAGSVLLEAAPRCRLNLDDAVTVLRNLSFSNSKEKSYTKSEIANIVGQQVQSAMLSFSKDSAGKSKPGSSAGPSSSSHTPPNKGKKSNNSNKGKRKREDHAGPTFCYDCGATDHKRGDEVCSKPSFMTKRLKEKGSYSGSGSPSGKKSNNNGSPFRPGSNPEKRNHH